MRHRKSKKILDRNTASRNALLRNLAQSLVLYEKIDTTAAKARTLRPIVERYITIARKGDLASRRMLLSYFYDSKAVNKLMEVLGPRYKERNGGYTRIMKLQSRKGDGAEISRIEFV